MKPLSRFAEYFKISQRRSSEGHLPVFTQAIEMAALFALRGIGPGYYHSAKLWRRNMPFKEKLQWVSEKKYQKMIRRYNPAAYHKISQHKLSEKAFLSLLGIPTPEFYGFFHPQNGRDAAGQSLRNAQDIERLLEQKGIKKFCIKELEGWGGRGFHAVEVCRDQGNVSLRPLGGKASCSIAEFLRMGQIGPDGALLEAYVEQHPVMRGLNASSLNTLRVLVLWPFDGEPHVVGAFVRIGRAGSLVDNTSLGGIAAVVDNETGQLSSAHFKPPHPDEFDCHPDHGSQIQGVSLPYWDDIKLLVCQAIRVFPHMRFCGFDVGISVNGPVIVELNVEPDKTSLMQINAGILKCLK
ncbi:sugar-transfer associated ATP-grasp domain-containing protein [Geoalkalibacter halelectricus]|uniref:sugar-transfer associated ATP-grasp domain-containing protein n=1 Tax=Geoalkalibacter halelectricus TaxID=2847045 RepID=UPI003D1DABF3